MRAIWSGTISFGLVNIPIRLFSATEQSRLDLDMLDAKDQSHIHFKRVNEKTGREVSYENIVKAYKYNGEYVVLEDEDFEHANAKKTKTIDIQNFVEEDEIDPMYFEDPYYIEPEKTGTKAYALLREALKKSGKVGISTFVLRNKESLAAVRVRENVLVLSKLRFEQEIRDPGELKIPSKANLTAKEVEMAVKLINQHTEKFDISSYKDEYTEELMDVIKQKAKGKQPAKVHKLEVVHTKSKDLMAQLKASLETKVRKAS